MPGLLDAADIAKLGSTETSSFDRLFIDLMTEHHKGAVAMAEFAASPRERSAPQDYGACHPS